MGIHVAFFFVKVLWVACSGEIAGPTSPNGSSVGGGFGYFRWLNILQFSVELLQYEEGFLFLTTIGD
jgi:hypothetical protein